MKNLIVLTIVIMMLGSLALSAHAAEYSATLPGIGEPLDITVDNNGRIYVADIQNRVLVFDSNHSLAFTIGTGIAGSGNNEFNLPHGVAVDSTGRIYVADSQNHRIQVFNSDGSYNTTIGTGIQGNTNNQFSGPNGIAIDARDKIYVSDGGNHRIQILNSDYSYSSTLGTGVQGSSNNQFYYPYGVAVDKNSKIYVGDSYNQRVQVFNSDLSYAFTIGTGVQGSANNQFRHPEGIAVDSQGHIFVADVWNYRVQVFNSDGSYNSTIGTTGVSGSGNNQFSYADGIAIDSADKLYVTDTSNNRVQIFNTRTGCYAAAPAAVPEGANFNVTVTCSGVTAAVFGVEFGTTMSGDGSTSATSYTPGTFVTGTGNATLTGPNSLAQYAVSRTGTDTATGDFTLGSFSITAVTGITADGTITVTLPASSFKVSDRDGAPIAALLEAAPDAVIVVRNLIIALLNGDVLVQSDGAVQQLVNISLDVDSQPYSVASVTGSNATITLTQFTASSTTINYTADMDSHLGCTDTATLGDGSNNAATAIGTITLLAGDVVSVSGDNEIDLDDVVLVAANFGSASNPQVDINKDGVVNIFDLVHVGRNYNAIAGACN